MIYIIRLRVAKYFIPIILLNDRMDISLIHMIIDSNFLLNEIKNNFVYLSMC